ncbi:hypothetical protein OGAPHI_002065 [Ogataea philodendri]|uniref:Uncharacterized protein n=1 Tax=Ogataea philodendri TaxID=1378263 RepID=A0A9P8T6Y8_9ASCO|nr:uncharacterized protein OGAPHI_002065 [Ogataea philodendri]KAH3668311.1 hypothetical protein OGAPHI_002065 [Ogataea philodendri]
MSKSLHPARFECREQNATQYVCNVLPVYVDYTGTVENGSQFWDSQLEKQVIDDKTQVVNYMRGRRLVGVEHAFAGEYKVDVFERKEDDGIESKYQLIGQSDTIVNFGHERLPEEADAVEKLMEWVSVAKHIHED